VFRGWSLHYSSTPFHCSISQLKYCCHWCTVKYMRNYLISRINYFVTWAESTIFRKARTLSQFSHGKVQRKTDLEHLYGIYSIPTHDKNQWLLLQCSWWRMQRASGSFRAYLYLLINTILPELYLVGLLCIIFLCNLNTGYALNYCKGMCTFQLPECCILEIQVPN